MRLSDLKGPRLQGPTRLLALLAVLWTIKSAEPVLAPAVLAFVLAAVFAPWVRGARRRGIPAPVSAAVLVALATVLLVWGFYAAVLPMARSLPRASIEAFLRQWQAIQGLPEALSAPSVIMAGPLADQPPGSWGHAIAELDAVASGHALRHALPALAQAGGCLLLCFFVLGWERTLMSKAMRASGGGRALIIGMRRAQRDIQGFFFCLGWIYAGVSVIGAAGWAWLGLSHPLAWGVACFLLNFIPYVGPLVLCGLLALAGYASPGPLPLVVLAPLLFLGLHFVESNVVSPWLVSRRLVLHPAVVLLSVSLGAWAWGLAGVVVAVPVLVAVRGLWEANQARNARSPSSTVLLARDSHSALSDDNARTCRRPGALR